MINVEYILNKVSQLEIMQKYFPGIVVVNKPITNPFRLDSKPGCQFKWTSNNRLLFYDYARPEYNFGCFDLVMRVFNIGFKEAVDRVIKDFNIECSLIDMLENNAPKAKSEGYRAMPSVDYKPKKNNVVFNVKTRLFNDKDLEYWSRYGVTLDMLKLYNIHAVNKYYRVYEEYTHPVLVYDHSVVNNNHQDPCYCYQFNDKVKLYRPFNKDKKWNGNVTKDNIQGLEQLSKLELSKELLVITSSMKDALSLVAVGIPAIAPQGEAMSIDSETIKDLKIRYQDIYIIYDADEAGIRNSIKHGELYNLPVKILPSYYNSGNTTFNQKDFADYRHAMGAELFKELLKEVLN